MPPGQVWQPHCVMSAAVIGPRTPGCVSLVYGDEFWEYERVRLMGFFHVPRTQGLGSPTV